MITTGKQGRGVAVVDGGADDGTVVRIADAGAPDAAPVRRPLGEVLTEREFKVRKGGYKSLTGAQRIAIAEALRDGDLELTESSADGDSSDDAAPVPRRAVRPYNRAVARRIKQDYETSSAFEYRLNGAGRMIVLPSETEPERLFIAGASGSGKSYFAADYMREYARMFPDRRILLFSTHEDEKAYQDIEIEAVALDEDFTAAPLALTDLEASLCVFDDCDALQDRKLARAVEALNLDLINNGRKYDIHVVTLSHVLMGYAKTRCQLMEASRVVFFPGGNDYHSRRWMKVYGGINDAWQKRILAEPSRWICVDMRQPRSYVTENAVVLVRGDPTGQ